MRSPFSENYIASFFSENVRKKPFIKVQNLENDPPPPFGTFPKNSSDLVAPHYPKFENFSHESVSPLKMAVLKKRKYEIPQSSNEKRYMF